MGSYEDLYRTLCDDHDALQEAIRDAVSIDRSNLTDECFRQSELHATWGVLSALAASEAKSLEFLANERVLPKLRLEAKATGKVTDQAAKDTALASASYHEAYEAYLDAQKRADILKKVEFALNDKSEMLRILTFRERNELRTSPQLS